MRAQIFTRSAVFFMRCRPADESGLSGGAFACELERIVNRCLEEDAACRWQSAAELERELGELAASTSPWKAVSVAAAILALFAAAYPYLHRAPKLTEKDTILLADFDNKAGDPVFDDRLRQGLSVELNNRLSSP